MSIASQHQEQDESSYKEQSNEVLFNNPIRLAGLFFLLGLVFRIIDIFVLEMNTTDFGILPSKIIPLFLILLYLRQTGRKTSDIGLHSSKWERNLVIAIIVSLVFNGTLVGGNVLVLLALNLQPFISIYKMDYIIPDLVFHTANAFMEEMLFRGIMLICFMSVMRPLKANILQGFLFGLWHVVWPLDSYLGGLISSGEALTWAAQYTLSSMVIGLLWGFMVQRTDSLACTIPFHFLTNLTSGYISVEPFIAGMTLGLGAVAIPLAFLTAKLLTNRTPELKLISVMDDHEIPVSLG